MKINTKKFLLLPLLVLLMILTAFPFISSSNVKALEGRASSPFQAIGTKLFYRESLETTENGYLGSCSFTFALPKTSYNSNYEVGYFYTFKEFMEENNITDNYYVKAKEAGVLCNILPEENVTTTPSPYEDAYLCVLNFHFVSSKLASFGVSEDSELFVCATIREKGASDDAWVYSEPLSSSAYGSSSTVTPENKPGNDKSPEQNVPKTDVDNETTVTICGIPAKTFYIVCVCVAVVLVGICAVAISDKKR